MQYRTLGRTGIPVSTVGMGTWQSFDVRGDRAVQHVSQLVTEALGCGVNLFDTAPMYGAAEEVLGTVLDGRREDVLIATKVLQSDAASARRQIEQSFRKLQTDVIDLMQIHNMAGWQKVTPVLEEYKARGKFRWIGITDYRTSMFPEMMRAMRTGVFDTIQIPYNVGDREAEREILPLAAELNIGVLVMTPLCPIFDRSRLLTVVRRHDVSFLEPYGIRTAGQALLAYVAANQHVSSLLPATSRLERVAENTAVGDLPLLPPDIARRVEALF